jgi:protein-S-isoprenylcysteine O-methyltransferase Ste14
MLHLFVFKDFILDKGTKHEYIPAMKTILIMIDLPKAHKNQSLPAPNRFPWPPVIYLSAAAVALAINAILPLPWPTGGSAASLLMVGLFCAALAFALDLSAALAFRKHKTTILPHRAASNLITSGPFRFSRNPIYVANTLLMTAAGLIFGIGWLVIAAGPAAVLTHHLAVKREEVHLAKTFGSAWATYAARVPRWVGLPG